MFLKKTISASLFFLSCHFINAAPASSSSSSSSDGKDTESGTFGLGAILAIVGSVLVMTAAGVVIVLFSTGRSRRSISPSPGARVPVSEPKGSEQPLKAPIDNDITKKESISNLKNSNPNLKNSSPNLKNSNPNLNSNLSSNFNSNTNSKVNLNSSSNLKATESNANLKNNISTVTATAQLPNQLIDLNSPEPEPREPTPPSEEYKLNPTLVSKNTILNGSSDKLAHQKEKERSITNLVAVGQVSPEGYTRKPSMKADKYKLDKVTKASVAPTQQPLNPFISEGGEEIEPIVQSSNAEQLTSQRKASFVAQKMEAPIPGPLQEIHQLFEKLKSEPNIQE